MAQKLNLVTGACGFTGMHLVKQLLDDGQKVIATDLASGLDSPKARMIAKNLGLDFSHKNCTVIPADLTDRASLTRLFEKPVTHVFHTASLYDYSAPMEMLEKVNIQGGVNMFDLAVECPTLERFVHWSTCGVFGKPYCSAEGGKCNLPFTEDCPSPRNTPINLDHPPGNHLVNDYSITKWKQEQIAWKYHKEKGLPLTVVRPAPIYGPGSDYGHGGIILAVNKGLLPAIPKDSRNYITTSVHVQDVAGFARFIADRDDALGDDFNIVDDSIISYHEFLHYIALLLGRGMRDIPLVKQSMLRPVSVAAAKTWVWLERNFNVPRVRVLEVGSATYMASSYWISNKKSKDAGYGYRYPDVKEGLRDTLDWFRRVGWLEHSYNPDAAWKDKVA
ncbi:MAG: NAD-dependent epimerase/dehydratase family protein [Desulfatibacillaceae bacterium]